MYGLRIAVEGRMTNPASGGPSAVLADAPYSLVERVHIEGYHRPRAAQEAFFDMRGSDCRQLFSIHEGRALSSYILVNGSAAAALSTAASATNDFRYYLDVIFPPCVPDVGQSDIRQQMGYILDAPNYDRLQLTLFWGDSYSVFSGQTTAPTFSAYGSAVGSPRARVQGIFCLGGKNHLFQGFVPGRPWRYFVENTSGDIVSGATQSRQYNVPRGYRVRGVLYKSGVKATTTTSGNNAYSSLSDNIFSNLKFNYGTNKVIRFYQDSYANKEAVANGYLYRPDPGYGAFDFIKHGDFRETLDATKLIAGPTGDVDVFITADILAGANQASVWAVEEIRSIPILVSTAAGRAAASQA
jgi:hypothetical protein